MSTARECYLAAKAKFEAIKTQIQIQFEDTIIFEARNFLFDSAKEKSWLTAEYFVDELRNIEFPLEKLNLIGDNDEALYWIVATSQDPQFNDCSDFIMHFVSYCEKIPDLYSKSDECYYNTHLEDYTNVLAGQISDELILS